MTQWLIGAGAAGWAVAALLFWHNGHLKDEVVSCNTRIEASAAQGELEVAKAELEALRRAQAQQDAILMAHRRALEIAQEEAAQAASRPERVRTIIKEVGDACLDTAIDPAILNSLR